MTEERPGRQVVTFLILNNLTQWFSATFMMQKVTASPTCVYFFGFIPWVLVLRLTMPLVIFFRFHSSVVLFELWKGVYHRHDRDHGHDHEDNQRPIIKANP